MVIKTRSKSLKGNKLLDILYTGTESPACYTSLEPLYSEAIKYDSLITRRDVQKYLSTKSSYTRHRRAVRNYKRLPTIAAGLHTDWQADLADFQRIKNENKTTGFLLVCIDVLSRQLFVEPVKQKTALNMVAAFKKIFARAKCYPWRLYTDQGKEFTAQPLQALFKTNEIKHRLLYTSPQFHAGMVERAIRTIKERLFRYFTEKKTRCWISVIQKIVDSINNSPHSSLFGKRPIDVSFKNAHKIRHKQWEKQDLESTIKLVPRSATKKEKFTVEDHVRIEKHKHPFEKGYLPRFTKEIFKVVRVRKGDSRLTPTFPTTYLLEDLNGEPILGWFYDNDLCKVLNFRNNQ